MKRTVLVIDDEVAIGEVIRDYLADEGYEVWIATDGDEGLEVVQREKPSLILLDVLLPGMGGLECLKQIKKRHPDGVVIMLSGLHDETVAKQAIRGGAYDYITKPFNYECFNENILQRVFPEN